MEWVKQAKIRMNELENDLIMVKAKMGELQNDLNKATEALGISELEDTTNPDSTPVIFTPTTSTAPSVINSGARSVKIPIAARKALVSIIVRDEWEAKKPEYEETISKKLGVTWTCPIDYGTLWPYADDDFAKQNPGTLLTQYVEGFIWHLDYFIEKHGQLGIDELNRVAHTHTLIVAHIDNDPDMDSNGSDILDGVFRIVFKDGNIATNNSSACEKMSSAINKGGLAQAKAAPSSAPFALDFEDRSDIARNWDAALPDLQAEFQKLLNAPVFTLSPNFEQNAAKLLAWETAHGNKELRDDWHGRMGEITMMYFEGARSRLEESEFAGDDLLQEGFKDVVDKNEITLWIVDALVDGERRARGNEVVFENGVAVMQTTPAQWTVNARDPFENIVGLL